MATHLMDVNCGGKKYYISHVGKDVYSSTIERGRGTTTIKGLEYRSNEIIVVMTGKKAGEFDICQKIRK